jgi:protein-disulfide isomerase
VREIYGDRVKFVWKDFPLTSIHPQAVKASEAAHCAGDQGKYWEYHDVLFTNQRALQVEQLKKYAADLRLDTNAFNLCLDEGKHAKRVQTGLEEATKLGLSSTPSIFINGRLLLGAQPLEAFQSIIDEELERAGKR